MSSTETASGSVPAGAVSRGEIVNDFSLQVATVNGSGSQSSNNILMRAIFQMGVPVSGKNLFPSNIAGLPTWFTIRASRHGYVGRRKEIDILIAMNAETVQADLAGLEPGAAVIHDEKLRIDGSREDLILYPVPFSELASEVVSDARLRKLIANMVYVGSAAELFSIDMAEVESAIAKWFKAKKKAVETNIRAAHLGARFVRENLKKRDPYRVERMEATEDRIIIDGNSACALGSVFAGCSVATWYPITPSSDLCDALERYAVRFRMGKDGRPTFAILQAEDELAALGMAIGAGWAGARAMTATSGPGISLMAEFAGLAYFAEVPCVVFDVQRVGPSTGLPTRTSQGDVLSLYYLSHGDTRHIVLFPCDMTECFDFAIDAFDLADRFQQPVFVALDLDLGMNNWMSRPFTYPEKPLDRGKVLTAEQLEEIQDYGRYKDVDGDGIGYRTIPGIRHPRGTLVARGSGRNRYAKYSERPEDYIGEMDRLNRKFAMARSHVPQPVVEIREDARVGLVAYGSTDLAMRECRDQLKREYGLTTSYLRVRALPFTDHVRSFVARHEVVHVIEQNRDGQLADLMKLEVGADCEKIRKVLHYGGIPVDARFVTDKIVEFMELERIA